MTKNKKRDLYLEIACTMRLKKSKILILSQLLMEVEILKDCLVIYQLVKLSRTQLKAVFRNFLKQFFY